MGVVLDLVVRLVEDSGKPSIIVEVDLIGCVLHVKVSQDCGSCRVRWNDERFPGREALSLIEIYGLRYIVRNLAIVLSELFHAIDLDRQGHRDSAVLQLSCERQRLGSAPTMSIENDLYGVFLSGRQNTIFVRIQPQNGIVDGFLPFVISKYFDLNRGSVPAAENRRE